MPRKWRAFYRNRDQFRRGVLALDLGDPLNLAATLTRILIEEGRWLCRLREVKAGNRPLNKVEKGRCNNDNTFGDTPFNVSLGPGS